MRNRLYRFLVFALMLAFAIPSLSAPAYAASRNNSFTLYNDTDESIVEIYIFPSSRGRGTPRNYGWIHSGDSTVINLSNSDLNSRASWSMTAGFKTKTGIHTIRWDNLSPSELVNAGSVTIYISRYGEYELDYSAPYSYQNDYYSYSSSSSSISECLENGGIEVDASSWFRGNNPSVHPSKMIDGDVTTSWDSDDEWWPDFWFTVTDGSEYTLTGFKILNGKFDEYQYYRNNRVAKLKLYVDNQYVGEYTVNDQNGVYQTIWLDEPVSGTEFFFHVSSMYTDKKYQTTRNDLCIAEFELF